MLFIWFYLHLTLVLRRQKSYHDLRRNGVATTPLWISPLGAKSESMWYALIVWPFIYKIRPFWSKSVKKCSRSDVIMTVTPRPTKNIETKRKKNSIFQYFLTKFATCVESYLITIWYLYIMICAKMCAKNAQKLVFLLYFNKNSMTSPPRKFSSNFDENTFI